MATSFNSMSFKSSIQPVPALRHNNHAQASRLTNNTPANALERQSTQACLRLLYFRDFIDVLEADRSNGSLGCVSVDRAVCARLAFLAVMVVHGSGDVSCAADLGLDEGCAGGGQEESGGGRRAEGEVEGAVGADGNSRGDGGADDVL